MQGRIKIEGPALRRVMVHAMENRQRAVEQHDGSTKLLFIPVREEKHEGLFHGWSTFADMHSDEQPVAIVEKADGNVVLVNADLIRFLDTKDLYHFKEYGDDPATAV